MDIGYAIAKGIVQGFAEFLPISSTAHLLFMDVIAERMHWLDQTSPAEKEFFDVSLHMGTLAAVTWYFRADLMSTWRQAIGKQPPPDNSEDAANTLLPLGQLPKFLAVSMACTIVFVLILREGSKPLCDMMGWTELGIGNISEFFYHFPQLVAMHLIITGFLLYFTQQYSDKKLAATGGVGTPVTLQHAIGIGIFQGISAVFRGISRSGSTISAGLATGLDRVTATRYSFLLSIPTFVLAMVYEMKEFTFAGGMNGINWPAIVIGTIASGVVGYYCVKYFLKFLANNTLMPFAIYCWLVGFGMLAYLMGQF